ncbi:MAG: DUF664 domain-containing protein, partial [Brachybacterium sp.]|nr:DUF664 domain-containing protein [Brachybacterium sp.]
MPFLTPDVTDERDGLATFVEHQIQQLASTLHNLDREQLAATPTASSLSLGALMRHCVFVAERFAEAIRVAPDCPEAPQRSADQAAAEEGLETRALRAEDTPRILLAELERVGAEIAAAIR